MQVSGERHFTTAFQHYLYKDVVARHRATARHAGEHRQPARLAVF
jgi:hypothetical protein